jgi:hypothetical protein
VENRRGAGAPHECESRFHKHILYAELVLADRILSAAITAVDAMPEAALYAPRKLWLAPARGDDAVRRPRSAPARRRSAIRHLRRD